jgi:GGDEF domain-containing protein
VRSSADAAELVRYEELLYDKLTGFPTLPVMIERARELLERRGELTVLYIHFVWYEKIEEIYGWQKLDDVLETTAQAVRRFYAQEHSPGENIMMVSHIADDDFILFTEVPSSPQAAEQRLREISGGSRLPARQRRGRAQRGHRGAVRHLRRRGDGLPQPEDPHGAAALPRHPRGRAGRARRGGVGAHAQGQ